MIHHDPRLYAALFVWILVTLGFWGAFIAGLVLDWNPGKMAVLLVLAVILSASVPKGEPHP